jgi:HK97 family phage major capsid protein
MVRSDNALRHMGPNYEPTRSPNGIRGETKLEQYAQVLHARTLEEYDTEIRTAHVRSGEYERREQAFMRYVRNGHAESRDMGYLTGSAGGFTVPPGSFYDNLYFQWVYSSALLSKSRKWNSPTGNPATFVLALSDATAGNTGSVGENTQLGNTDLSFTNVSFGETVPFVADNLIRQSRNLFTDSQIDPEQLIRDAYAFRMGKACDAAFMATALANGSVGKTVTAANTAPTIQDLNALLYSLDANNRNAPNSALIVSKATALAMRNWTDNTAVTPGRPLLLDQTMTVQSDDYSGFGSAGLSQTLRFMSYAGVPILESPNVGNFAAGAVFGIFANFDRYGLVRVVDDSVGLQWLHERYADFGQVGAVGTGRFDFAVADYTAGQLWQAHA